MGSSRFEAGATPVTSPDRSEAAALGLISGLLLGPPSAAVARGLAAAGLGLPEPADPEALARDHLRLLGGLRPGHGPPPPYESVWRGEGRVMGRATEAVLSAYDQAGAWLEGADGRPADHVGFEIGFLSYLAKCHDEAAGRDDSAARLKAERAWDEFMADHVMMWVPDLCRTLERADPGGFYGTLAAWLGNYLAAAGDAEPAEP
ncbi:MAG: molecular chaperone TorD family protein [Propionibacteriaceae bacterium]|jgi:TorA maturation chaperone TorD|nr:molecular chaperone TorD family protein [Propionibacteriaceae bacterium]